MGTDIWRHRLVTGLRWFVAVEFLTFPWLKFSSQGHFGYPPYPDRFVEWGYPAYFSYLVGAIELLAGMMLILPRRYFLGAVALAGVMVGATVTHIINRDGWSASVAAPVHLLFALILALAWWPADWREPLRGPLRAANAKVDPSRKEADVMHASRRGVSP